MQRFYVGGIPNSVTKEDLQALFAKRSFAIVRLSGIDLKAESTLKRLDGGNWKGGRLRIEKAKEWYNDRFEAERANAHVAPIKPQQAVSKNRTQTVLPFTADAVKIRRRKGMPALKAATKPLLKFHNKTYGTSFITNVKACRKIVFDDNDAENFITENNLVSIDVTAAPSSSSSQQLAVKNVEVTLTETATKVVVKGGGQRKGFGSLLHATLLSEPPPQLPTTLPSARTNTQPNGRSDDMYELADFEEGPGKEMSEEELREDRQRMLRVALMLATGNKSQTQPTIATKQPEKKEAKKKPIGEDTSVDEKVSKKRKLEEQKPEEQSPIPSAAFTTADDTKKTVVDDAEEHFTSGFAQMNSLKSIFAKQQGGIWWNDEGKVTSNAREERGVEYLDDIIFQEAERYGLDVRSSMDSSATIARSNKDESKSMLFSFFSEEEDSSATKEAVVKEAPKLKAGQLVKPELPIIAAKLPSQLLITDHLEEMVNNAKRFRRDRSVEEIQQEWQENSKQLMMIMKKKARVMAKRAEEQRSSHGYHGNQSNKRQKQQEK